MHFSKTYKKHYWFNTTDGSKRWDKPDSCPDRGEEEDCKKARLESPVVAIIVPFRDLEKSQRREEELNKFVPHFERLCSGSAVPVKIFIIEQSNDNRKFNRGKLLNIGFEIARRDGCKVYIFHDVDLLPSPELFDAYKTPPGENPVHIASVWNRYNKNPKYFGGIVSFSEEQFVKINGFPNNFWGSH